MPEITVGVVTLLPISSTHRLTTRMYNAMNTSHATSFHEKRRNSCPASGGVRSRDA
jgi:hypothetical protein